METAAAGAGLSSLLRELEVSGVHVSPSRVERAWSIAERTYGQERHWTGVTLREHVLGVLRTLLPFQPDEDAIVACILHHVLQAGLAGLPDLAREFGGTVTALVRGVHLLSHVTMENKRMSLEDLRSMLLSVSDDMRVTLLILCDRCHVLDCLTGLPAPEQRRIAQDVLRLFAPVAARLGIYALKHTLESRAFPVAYPTDAQRIAEQLRSIHERDGDFLPVARETLRYFLLEQGISADIDVREKQIYSIFQKMQSKSLSHVDDIYDLFALRVVVDAEDTCYRVLGLLHRIGHPVPQRFKDYIAFPKPNGYRSLHTTLARLPDVPENVFTEVQVRTQAMHREAELGIAAHWKYKEGAAAERATRKAQLQRMLSLGAAPLRDHIFVLTPRGDIVELPEGATPLDFAFHVHSALGLSFRAAKVNGAIASMGYELQNGDTVEILKYREPQPSARWLQMLRTAAARSRLRKYFLERETPVHDSVEKPPVTAHRAVAVRKESADPATSLKRSVVAVDGGVPLPLRYARCCRPEEGGRSALAGVIARTGEVRVHREMCKCLRNVNPERRIGVRWKTES